MASSFGRLVQVDYETRRVVATLELHGAAPLTCVAATEGFVATSDAAGLLRLWPLDFGAFLLQAQHDAGVASLAVSPSDLRIAVSTASGTLGVLDVTTHANITAVRPHRTGVAALAFSARKRLVQLPDASSNYRTPAVDRAGPPPRTDRNSDCWYSKKMKIRAIHQTSPAPSKQKIQRNVPQDHSR